MVRILRRAPVLLACPVLCWFDCLVAAAVGRLKPGLRARVLQRWSRWLLVGVGVEVETRGPIPSHGLIASNHLSYLDILVLSATARCVFVSKREVKWWPFVGWVAAMTGAVFVDRSRPGQTYSLLPQMQQRLASGESLVLFPEGTSGGGKEVLPFRSSLFEAAVKAEAPITAAYLLYELPAGDGDPVMDVCYWGDMTLLPQLLKLLSKKCVRATVVFGERARVFADRKEAAQELRREVVGLGEIVEPRYEAAHPG